MIDFDSFSFSSANQDSGPWFINYKGNYVGCPICGYNDDSVYDYMYFLKKRDRDWDQDCIVQALRKEFNISPKFLGIYIPSANFLLRLSFSRLGYLLLHRNSVLRNTVAIHVARRAKCCWTK